MWMITPLKTRQKTFRHPLKSLELLPIFPALGQRHGPEKALTTSELKPEEPEAGFDDSTPWLVYKLKRICRYAVLSIYDSLAAPVFFDKVHFWAVQSFIVPCLTCPPFPLREKTELNTLSIYPLIIRTSFVAPLN